jgi:beta-glucosidase
MTDPLFPFGFGLSYTSFSIGEARLFNNVIKAEERAELTIPVSNIGKVAGTEVVQLYIHKVNDKNGPNKTLRDFRRVNLAPGRSVELTFDLPGKAFEFFDESSGKIAVIPGEYELWYGNSSSSSDLKMIKVTIL